MCGGVQRVTDILGNYFVTQCHSVYYLGLKEGQSPYQYVLPDKQDECSKINLQYISTFIKEKKIHITIFQEGISPIHAEWAYTAKRTGSKLISCIHNSMFSGISNMEFSIKQRLSKFHLTPLACLIKLPFIPKLVRIMYVLSIKSHYKKLCDKSDHIVLLSASHQQELNEFIPIKQYHNISVIPNPLPPTIIEKKKKKKNVLYVGRLDTKLKRVDLLIEIWEKVSKEMPDWTMDILGNGEAYQQLNNRIKSLGLKNIKLHGFIDPTSFYEESAIFCMTSQSEGFGMVLIESMRHGVVPIAFDSYLAVKDIIDDHSNGLLVTPMDTKEYSEKLIDIMRNNNKREIMSKNAIIKSTQFNIEKVGEKWIQLFNSLLH